MKTALVLGIRGGFGGHVADELARNGWKIRALLREASKSLDKNYDIEEICGDAGNIHDVRTAAIDVDLIVYGINVPYPEWGKLVVPMLEVSAKVAEENNLGLLFPGNVYTLDPAEGPEFDESVSFHPPTDKGELRATMEARLKVAANRGAKVVIIRAGDFIGAGAENTWMGHLIKSTRKGYTLQTPSEPNLIHTWAYLPDLARVAVKVLENPHESTNFNVFNFKGYRVNFNDIAKAIETATGKSVKMKAFPWGIIKIIQIFSPAMRCLLRMQYLWKCEINLSDQKLAAYLGQSINNTPLAQALLDSGVLGRVTENLQNELKRA